MKQEGQTWQSDLAEAHKLEDLLASKFTNEFQCTVTQAPKDSSFPDYDMMLGLGGQDFTIELKQDRNTWTGNVAVEIGRTVNGVYKDTGIAASKADVFVYYFEGNFWLIHSCELKELIKNCYTARGGDGNRAHIRLLSKQKFLNIAKNIKSFND